MRRPSFKKRIAARTSFPRFVRHSLGLKAPRGFGWVTNPKRAAYNRIYNRTTFKADDLIVPLVAGVGSLLVAGIASIFSKKKSGPVQAHQDGSVPSCPRCSSAMVLRNGSRGQFFGCSRFPRCRGTRNFIKQESVGPGSLEEPKQGTDTPSPNL